MTRMSLTGSLSVQLNGFVHPFLRFVPEDCLRAVRELVLLIVGAASVMVSELARRLTWGPRRMIHRERRLCRHVKSKAFDDVGLKDHHLPMLLGKAVPREAVADVMRRAALEEHAFL